MKKILIVHSNMELGGVETSLLGLLQSIDYSHYAVDLMLFEQKGDLLEFIPKEVTLIHTDKKYQCIALPIKDVLFKNKEWKITLARLYGKIRGKRYKSKTYATKQFAHLAALPFFPQIQGEYDLAISFIDPHFIVTQKVKAKKSVGWLHTDFSRIYSEELLDKKMWGALNYVAHISASCKEKFDNRYPEFINKSIIVENILSKSLVEKRALEFDVSGEMDESYIRLLSVGRFCEAKNFDNIPEICSEILQAGKKVKWYIIGFGSDEVFIQQKIVEYHMQEHVLILGKKVNPYPYIKACDLYVQPSRYEGNCVSVREAQMLEKPVIITRYPTSASQLEDGVDGVIVAMDNQNCAEGIVKVLNNPNLMNRLTENCRKRDYSNSEEIKKIYKIMEK